MIKALKINLLADDSSVKQKLATSTMDAEKLKGVLGDLKMKADDSDALYKVTRLDMAADRLREKLASPRITIAGFEKASLELLRLEAQADNLGRKLGNERVSERGGLFSGLTGNGEGIGSFLMSPAGIVSMLGGAAALGPAIAGGGLSLGVGGIGTMLAEKFDKKGLASAFAPVRQDLKSIGQSVAHDLLPVFHQLAGFIHSIAPEMRTLFRSAVPQIKQFVQAIEPAVKQALPELVHVMTVLTRSGLMTELGKAFGILLVDGVKMLDGLSAGFKASGRVIEGTVHVAGSILVNLSHIIGDVAAFVSDIIHGKWTAAFHVMGDVVRSQANTVRSIFGGLPGFLLRIGEDAMRGLLSGLQSVGSSVLNWISHFASSIPSKFMSLLGIHSPSTVMAAIGLNLGKGLQLGMDASHAGVLASATRMATGIPAAFTGMHGTAAGNRQPVIVIEASAHESDLVKALMHAFRYEIRTKGGGNVQRHLGWGMT